MRRTGEPKWVVGASGVGDGGALAGIALGSDFVAEHEHGVADLRRAFGLNDAENGIARRRVRCEPEGFWYEEGRDRSVLGYTRPSEWTSPKEFWDRQVKERELRKPWSPPGEVRNLAAAWDEKSFGIVAWGKKRDTDRKYLRTLHEAFRRQDIAFWPNVGPFHIGGGLIFAIVSQVSEENRKAILEADLDEKALKQAAGSLKLEEHLRSKGLGWFSLAPAWSSKFKSVIRDDGSEPVKTEHPVMFWLNPRDQHLHNSGWYTVEQLQAWAEGKGPVLKRKR